MLLIGNLCAIVVVLLALMRQWTVSQGDKQNLRVTYWLMIGGGTVNIIQNVAYIIVLPQVFGLMAYIPVSLWAMAMGIRGLSRLRSAEGA